MAVTTLAPEFIEEKLGTQEFPEILKSTRVYMLPSKVVHTVIQKSTCVVSRAKNIAVMVNGIPMNDMEWGRLVLE